MEKHYQTHLTVKILIFLIAVICSIGAAYADTNQAVRLFVLQKSKNPQNILVVYASIDSDCRFQPISDGGGLHMFDFYWLMDGTTFKPTHRLIKKAARKRFVTQKIADHGQSFSVLLADLKELKHDLPSDRIDIDIYRDQQAQCRPRVVLVLGPSHSGRTMAIDTIYSRVKTFLGIPIGIYYIELRGRDIQNNEPVIARLNSDHQSDLKKAIEEDAETISN